MAAAGIAAVVTAVLPANGATGGTVVGAYVPSATLLTPACASGSAATDFGAVLPGSSSVTTADCVVSFGSSNDTASLLMSQADGASAAMGGASTGAPDATFAGGTATFATSVVSTSVTSGGSALQADGKLLVAAPLGQTAGTPFDVRRIKTDGTLDTTGFGTSGVASIAMGSGQTAAYAVEPLPDGSSIVCGYSSRGTSTGNDVAFAKLAPNGTLDTSWGTGGRVYVALSNGTDICYDLAVRPAGRILAAGGEIPTGQYNPALVQLLPDGSLDPAFGTGGIARPTLGSGVSDYVYAVELADDGAAIAVGTTADGDWAGAGQTYSDLVVAVIDRAGRLDTTFNGTGWRALSVATTDVGVAVGVQRDGKLLLSARSLGATWDAVAWRLLRTGVLDPAFNGAAPIVTDGGATDFGGGIVQDPSGKVLHASSRTTGGIERLHLRRYLDDGTPDPSFSGGSVTVLVGDSANKARSVHLLDGKPTIVGYGVVGGRTQPIVARFAAPSIPDYAAGVADWAVGTAGAFGVCTRQVASATAAWAVAPANDCTAAVGSHWRAVPSVRELPAARVATTAGTVTGTVRLRFGLRVAGDQTAGGYGAPVTFATVAPQL